MKTYVIVTNDNATLYFEAKDIVELWKKVREFGVTGDFEVKDILHNSNN